MSRFDFVKRTARWRPLYGVLVLIVAWVVFTSRTSPAIPFTPNPAHPANEVDGEALVRAAQINTSAQKVYATRTVEAGWTGLELKKQTIRTTEAWVAPGDRTYSRSTAGSEHSEVVVYESGAGAASLKSYRRVEGGSWTEISFKDIGFNLDALLEAAALLDTPIPTSTFRFLGETTRDGTTLLRVREEMDVRFFDQLRSTFIPGSPLDSATSSSKFVRMTYDYYIEKGRLQLHSVVTSVVYASKGSWGRLMNVKQYFSYPYPVDWPLDLPAR